MEHQPFTPMTLEDILEVLCVSRRTVEYWIADGQFPTPSRLGRRRTWHPSTFYAWLAEQCPEAVQPGSIESPGIPARATQNLPRTARASHASPNRVAGKTPSSSSTRTAERMRARSAERIEALGLDPA